MRRGRLRLDIDNPVFGTIFKSALFFSKNGAIFIRNIVTRPKTVAFGLVADLLQDGSYGTDQEGLR